MRQKQFAILRRSFDSQELLMPLVQHCNVLATFANLKLYYLLLITSASFSLLLIKRRLYANICKGAKTTLSFRFKLHHGKLKKCKSLKKENKSRLLHFKHRKFLDNLIGSSSYLCSSQFFNLTNHCLWAYTFESSGFPVKNIFIHLKIIAYVSKELLELKTKTIQNEPNHIFNQIKIHLPFFEES